MPDVRCRSFVLPPVPARARERRRVGGGCRRFDVGRRRQRNALKTVVAMPFVLDGESGQVEIATGGQIHTITMKVDRIKQCPVIQHAISPIDEDQFLQIGKNGTAVAVHWPDSACSMMSDAKARFLQIADDYTWLNPHLSLAVNWFGEPSGTTWRS